MKWSTSSSAFSFVVMPDGGRSRGSSYTEMLGWKSPQQSSLTRLVVQAPERAWRSHVEKQLEELIRLEHGWDGYRGLPVSLETANFALRMLESICDDAVPTPNIVPGTNGDVQFEWHTEKGDVELHVRRANSVHAWRKTEQTGPDGEECELTFNFLPILSWLEDLSEPSVDANSAAA